MLNILTETWFRYFLLNPLIRILTKSPTSALQSTLHALFLPTPFKYLAHSADDTRKRAPEEVLKPGALYAECAVVPVQIPVTSIPPVEDKAKGGGEDRDTQGSDETRPDDGELGGVGVGMQVWDDYERELKTWDIAEAHPTDDEEHQPGATSS
jgi:hypothetical protein